MLVWHYGHSVEKPELRQAVWPDIFVEETNLTKPAFTLRQMPGESVKGASYTETMPKRGDCFVAKMGVLKTQSSSRTESGAG